MSETRGYRAGMVALVGRPNAGKSTLLNRLVGAKVAITSNKPQTTRHRILGVLTRPGGQVVFVDTPGVHRPYYRMNKRMMDATRAALHDVDLVALLIDVTEDPGAGLRYAIDLVGKAEIEDVEEMLDVRIGDDEFETVGGMAFLHFGYVPKPGESFDRAGLHIEVLEADERRVHRVRITATQPAIE